MTMMTTIMMPEMTESDRGIPGSVGIQRVQAHGFRVAMSSHVAKVCESRCLRALQRCASRDMHAEAAGAPQASLTMITMMMTTMMMMTVMTESGLCEPCFTGGKGPCL